MSVQNSSDKKSLKRKAFLDAARKVFCEKGYQMANVSDIVAEIKSGQGTFYYHFKDKQAIFDELMIGFIDQLTGVLIENETRSSGRLALADRDLAIENARRIAGAYMHNMDLATLFFSESRYVGGAAMDRMDRLYSLIYSQLENGLREGIKAGLIRPGVDPHIAARCFVGATERVIQDALSSGGPHNLDLIAAQIVDFQSFGVLSKLQREKFKNNQA